MTSFEVDDRFAGKKGPCPKCGHIIEIPKEKLVIHAPDSIIDGSKTRKTTGHDARPILQERFTFTGGQVALWCVGAAAFLAISYLAGLAHNGWVSLGVGAILALLIAFPIADFGYMITRDDNDLDEEMFKDVGERRRRSFYASLVFVASWFVFEGFVYFLGGTGLVSCCYLVVIAMIGAIGAVVFFDCNYGKALLIYMMFAVAAVVGRGLIIDDGWTPNGWVWNARHRPIAEAKPRPGRESATPPTTESPEEPTPAAPETKEPPKPTLSREAPKIDLTKERPRR